MKDQIKELLEAGTIRPSNSLWAVLVVFVKKPNDILHFWVDYCTLNKVTIKYLYPLLQHKDLMDCLGSVKYFTSLDLHSG